MTAAKTTYLLFCNLNHNAHCKHTCPRACENMLTYYHVRQKLFIIAPSILFFLFSDQLTKVIAKSYLQNQEPLHLFNGIITFSYIENPFGFLGILTHFPDNIRPFFLVLGVFILLIALLSYALMSKKITRIKLLCLSMIVAGGISNLVDRLIQEIGVIDYMSFGFGTFRTGLCNLADVYILFGSFLLGFLIAKTL